MKRGFLLLAPMALAAIVFAQGAEDPADLVKKLGAPDYAVREEAQRKLVEMGEKAVPALEEALKSDDLEVRLRAGRALRAIGSESRQAEEAQPDEPDATGQPARPGVQGKSTSFSISPGKVVVTVTETVAGKQVTKTYEASSMEELKEKYPELDSGNGLQFRFGTRDDFDMDKFWHEWTSNFDNFDDDMKNWQDETRREVEQMRRWLEHWRNQPQRMRPDARLAYGGGMLGVRGSMPTAVLDAQLDLRGKGIVIDAVEKDSLADRLGLARFDVLVELNGREIRGAQDVAAALQGRGADAKISAKVLRHAQEMTLPAEARAAGK
ncbi:MAG TPA: HEAT repeat domain-containing protein [Planctomycetota bacterium]|nr:HEAT repeat domain-containing protein [Planctomycetota bacterium]